MSVEPVPAPPAGRRARGSGELQRLAVLIAGVALMLAAAWLLSPWWASWRLVQDARAGDAAAVSRRLDAPLVRESLQPQVEARLHARLARARAAPAPDIWSRLALLVAPAATAPAVQVAVTPSLVADAVRHVYAPTPSLPGSPAPAPPAGPGDPRFGAMGYPGQGLDRDWDGFEAVVASRSAPGRRLTLHLLRHGLFTWRLVALDLPAG